MAGQKHLLVISFSTEKEIKDVAALALQRIYTLDGVVHETVKCVAEFSEDIKPQTKEAS